MRLVRDCPAATNLSEPRGGGPRAEFSAVHSWRSGGIARFAGGGCDEALMERALMSPVGLQFLVNVAPPIDKVLIPRTNGRLGSAPSAAQLRQLLGLGTR